MTKIPLLNYSLSIRVLPVQTLHRPSAAARIRTMAANSDPSGAGSEAITGGYPKPVSPAYPEASREVEARRAVAAEERSAAHELSAGDVVFEDEWLAVVNKPSGIYCETLLTSLASLSGTETVHSELHMANRLDRDTSGLMVITKSNKVAGKFVKAFTHHKVKKTYLALCIGRAPSWEKITIKSGHGRSKFGAWRVYSVSDVGRSLPGGSKVKQMTTSFEVLSVNRQGKFREQTVLDADEVESVVVQEKGMEWNTCDNKEKCDEILIRAYPQSGRTHQIRLHCQYLGIPLRGDVKYEGVQEWKGVTCDGHALHAESLSFKHPVTGEFVQFHAPVPSWAKEVCEEVNILKNT